MKKQHYLILLFSLAVLFFVYGTFADRQSMKASAVGLTIVMLLSIGLSSNKTDYLSDKTQAANSALAASNAFVFLLILMGFVFLWNIFINPVANLDFAVFGSMFLTIVLMRILIVQAIGNYLGKGV